MHRHFGLTPIYSDIPPPTHRENPLTPNGLRGYKEEALKSVISALGVGGDPGDFRVISLCALICRGLVD